uniref:Uncharacterized protein n=1 Tax=Parascaris equorum TaxID=6256 RepID=A0A914RZS8_PAREQ
MPRPVEDPILAYQAAGEVSASWLSHFIYSKAHRRKEKKVLFSSSIWDFHFHPSLSQWSAAVAF